jgi:glucosyl-3-phosphoglycerate synthase
MTDFFQNGSIATLQNITRRPLADIERELRQFAKVRPMVLLLPALYSEFEGTAMPRIIADLKDVDYLHAIVLSLDRASAAQFTKVRRSMARLRGPVKIVWHGGPRMQKLYKQLKKSNFRLDSPGKGQSVWMTLGYILADQNIYAIGLHDCDIVNYTRELMARLFYPVVHPGLDYEFSKGYYARVSDRLYGRVTRLFYTPLVRSLKKMLSFNPFLDYLDSFRYALSGEFAFINILARSIRISPTWGLEVSMLSEVYTQTTNSRVAQVEIIDTYEHKHQKIRKERPAAGLIRMAADITKTLLRVLSQDGTEMSQSFFRALLTTYIQESRFAIEKYNALAILNGLFYDRHQEIEASEAFIHALEEGITQFTTDPVGIPMLPAWVRVQANITDFSERITEAVEMDNK